VARSKSTFLIYAEYIPLRGLFSLLSTLPLAWAERLGETLSRFLIFFLTKRRKMIRSNIALSLPHLSDAERETIAQQSVRNLGRGVGMFAHISRFAKNNFKDVVELEGEEHVEAAKRLGKGVLCFSAHYGCWEMIGAYVPTLFSNGAVLVRPLDNPKLETLVAGVRSSGGGMVLQRKNIFREGLRLLRRNGALGILVDQNFAQGGVFVEFFGRLAATTPVIPLLARRSGAPILPVRSVWSGHKIRIIFEAPMRLSQNPDAIGAQTEDVQRMTSVIERWVREEPGHWLWIHNRWKKRPEPDEVPAALALPDVPADVK
jgi:KDO2-lipid IV(A) lauroyltransferase